MKNSVSNNGIPKYNICFALAVVFLISATSCSVSLFPGYRHISEGTPATPSSWFRADTGHFLFNTKIDVMKNHFTGLTVIKPGAASYRTIMITETGLKIFDFEFFPDSAVKIHYIPDAINKKLLIRTLTSDISLLLMNSTGNKIPEWFTERKSSLNIARYKIAGRRMYYYFSEGFDKPSGARYARGIINKAYVDFYGTAGLGLDSVKLSHFNIALDLSLYRIRE